MSAISETYNRAIFWSLWISYQISLSQQVKWTLIITNKNGKYELTDDLPND